MAPLTLRRMILTQRRKGAKKNLGGLASSRGEIAQTAQAILGACFAFVPNFPWPYDSHAKAQRREEDLGGLASSREEIAKTAQAILGAR